jgi:hypothetical protein
VGDPCRFRSCSEPIASQVSSLAKLEPGWFDGDGTAYDPVQLAWVSEQLAAVVSRCQLPGPYVYPTPEGDVRAEWSTAHWEVSVSFVLDTREARLFAASVDSDEFVERTVTVDGATDELDLFLREHVGSV